MFVLEGITNLQYRILNAQAENDNTSEKIAILCLAYRNLGVELEHLKRVIYVIIFKVIV